MMPVMLLKEVPFVKPAGGYAHGDGVHVAGVP